jgi:flagellar hook-associated protein 3 FlgL
MVQGISDFQNQQTGYDTALKTYAMVQRMSLFQYIQG